MLSSWFHGTVRPPQITAHRQPTPCSCSHARLVTTNTYSRGLHSMPKQSTASIPQPQQEGRRSSDGGGTSTSSAWEGRQGPGGGGSSRQSPANGRRQELSTTQSVRKRNTQQNALRSAPVRRIQTVLRSIYKSLAGMQAHFALLLSPSHGCLRSPWLKRLANLPLTPRLEAVKQLLRIEDEGAYSGLVGGSPETETDASLLDPSVGTSFEPRCLSRVLCLPSLLYRINTNNAHTSFPCERGRYSH